MSTRLPAHLPLALGLALSGCAGWGNLPDDDYVYREQPLWDADSAVATADGIYVRLPATGGLALVPKQGEARLVEGVDEGRVRSIAAAPDGETLIAFIDRYQCDPKDEEDRKDLETVDDCDGDDLTVLPEMAVIRGGEVDGDAVPLEGAFNALAYSDDGAYAIAYFDFDDPNLDLSGVVSLDSVVVLDLANATSTTVGVGFAADQVLFVNNAAGAAERVVVLSQNSVAVIDLLLDVPERIVTFPLTLDPDSSVTPTGVSLTPDGQTALISVASSQDLYALDLVNESINIIELPATPSTLSVNTTTDRTVIVYASKPQVDILEHQFFDVTTIPLDEGMSRIKDQSDFAILWSGSGEKDVYRLDIANAEVVEYVLENPPEKLYVSPTEEFAIALTRPEDGFNDGVEGIYDASPGMEIIDLGDDDTNPFLLDGTGLGVTWSVTDGRLDALVLQEGVDYVYKIDLYTATDEKIELSAPPVAIGSLPDGTFWVTHDEALGLVSFLDPVTLEVTEVAGFASLGMFDEIELIADEKEGK